MNQTSPSAGAGVVLVEFCARASKVKANSADQNLSGEKIKIKKIKKTVTRIIVQMQI